MKEAEAEAAITWVEAEADDYKTVEAEAEAEAVNFKNLEAEAEAVDFKNLEAEAEAEAAPNSPLPDTLLDCIRQRKTRPSWPMMRSWAY